MRQKTTAQIDKSIDGVLGIRTRGRIMVGVDETTELWRPPKDSRVYHLINIRGRSSKCSLGTIENYDVLNGG